MKEANRFLFWVIGLPLAFVVWTAIVGVKMGLATFAMMLLSLMLMSLLQRKSR